MPFSLRRNDFHSAETGADDGRNGVTDVDDLAQLGEAAGNLEDTLDAHAAGKGNLVLDHLPLEFLVLHVEIDCRPTFIINSLPAIARVGEDGRDNLDDRPRVALRRQVVGAEDVEIERFALDLEETGAAAAGFVQFAQGNLRNLRIAPERLVEIGFNLAETGRVGEEFDQRVGDTACLALQVAAETGEFLLHPLVVALGPLEERLSADRERGADEDLHREIEDDGDAADAFARDAPDVLEALLENVRLVIDRQPHVEHIGEGTD